MGEICMALPDLSIIYDLHDMDHVCWVGSVGHCLMYLYDLCDMDPVWPVGSVGHGSCRKCLPAGICITVLLMLVCHTTRKTTHTPSVGRFFQLFFSIQGRVLYVQYVQYAQYAQYVQYVQHVQTPSVGPLEKVSTISFQRHRYPPCFWRESNKNRLRKSSQVLGYTSKYT